MSDRTDPQIAEKVRDDVQDDAYAVDDAKLIGHYQDAVDALSRPPVSSAALIQDSFREIIEHLREQEMIVAAHPDSLTVELRALIAATPLTTLRESRYVEPGKFFVIHPGLLGDLTEDSGSSTWACGFRN